MPLFLYADRAIFGTEIRFDLFASYAQKHIDENKKTSEIETLGCTLIATDFSEDKVANFVREVCGWGGYSGISGRILKRNSPSSICSAFRAAIQHVNCGTPQLSSALEKINALNGLGTPSFASKHLRFLCPELCPVFDSRLQNALPYTFDPSGYAAFAKDCLQIADILTNKSVTNPRKRPDGRWYASDVEAALYAQIIGLSEPNG